MGVRATKKDEKLPCKRKLLKVKFALDRLFSRFQGFVAALVSKHANSIYRPMNERSSSTSTPFSVSFLSHLLQAIITIDTRKLGNVA